MITKYLAILITLTMTPETRPLIQYNPDPRVPSAIPDDSYLFGYGLAQGKVQEFRVTPLALTQKVFEIKERGLMTHQFGEQPIIVKNCAFVMANETFGLSKLERFDLPYSSIQDAINAITPGVLNWTIIVYPGNYFGNIVLPENTNLYCYNGVTITGNLTLGNNTRLQFDCGSVVEGNIIDAGTVVNSVICGCLTHEGEIILTGVGSVLTAHGYQMFKATITNATFNCGFEKLKENASSYILGTGTSVINIKNLTAVFSGYALDLIRSQPGGVLNIYESTIVAGGKGVVFEGVSGLIWNSSITANLAVSFDGSGTFDIINNHIESLFSEAVVAAIASTAKIMLRRNYITVANSVNANASGVLVDTGNSLILEANTIIGKGVGNSVKGSNPTAIKTLRGNGSNVNVNANITETIDVIFQDAGYE